MFLPGAVLVSVLAVVGSGVAIGAMERASGTSGTVKSSVSQGTTVFGVTHIFIRQDAYSPARIQVVLGTTTMPVHQVLRLGRGAIIELDASEDDEVAILANNFPVAKGTVIVSGNRIAVEVKEIVPRLADMR